MTGQVTAPLLQASSLCPLSCARANSWLSLTLLPACERLLSSSGLSVQPSSMDSTQIELGILDIQLPPSSAMLSTPCPGSLGQVAGIFLFSSLQLPHSPPPTVPSAGKKSVLSRHITCTVGPPSSPTCAN